jgi:hypothetical protein
MNKLLEDAAEVVADRSPQYGSPFDSHAEVARLWGAYLGRAVGPRDVALMMVLLKVAREKRVPKRDNRLDIVGYAVMAEEIVREAERRDEFRASVRSASEADLVGAALKGTEFERGMSHLALVRRALDRQEGEGGDE